MGTARDVRAGDLYSVQIDRKGFAGFFVAKVVDVQQTFTRWGNPQTLIQVERETDGVLVQVAPRHLVKKLDTPDDLFAARSDQWENEVAVAEVPFPLRLEILQFAEKAVHSRVRAIKQLLDA